MLIISDKKKEVRKNGDDNNVDYEEQEKRIYGILWGCASLPKASAA